MISAATSGEGPLPYGMNAPGILEGLISRGRESVDQRSQQAARQYQDLFPAAGGAAARGAMDIYQRGASEAAQLETGLRAQAAENSLLDRLRLLTGAAGALGGVNAQGSLMQAMGLPASLTMALAGNQQNYAQQMAQMAQQNQQAGAGMMGQLGSGLLSAGGAVLGSYLMPGVGTAAGASLGPLAMGAFSPGGGISGSPGLNFLNDTPSFLPASGGGGNPLKVPFIY